jgi:rare lipoprotein A
MSGPRDHATRALPRLQSPLRPQQSQQLQSQPLRGLVPLLLASALLAACATAPRRPSTLPRPTPPPVPIEDIKRVPDAVPRAEPRSARGNPASYEALGRRYTILASSDGFVETGVASWYGADFHGKYTSSGEPYDMYAMTAAHKTLPIPCYARVTNLKNGRSVVVRINDRGPFVANRIVDLSYTAAAKLDMLREGTTFVELRVLSPGSPEASSAMVAVTAPTTTPVSEPVPVPVPAPVPPPPATAAPERQTWAQVGAFSDASNLERVLQRLQAAGLSAVTSSSRVNGLNVTRVRIGPIVSVTVFDALQEKLRSVGLGEAIIVSD